MSTTKTSAYFFTGDMNIISSQTLQQINSQVMYLSNAGYPYYQFFSHLNQLSAFDIRTELLNYDISVLHGHGNVGYLSVQYGDNNMSYLYSAGGQLGINDARLMDLEGEPITAKIMIFTSCHSASTNDNHTRSLANAAYVKGAHATLGYTILVAGGEWYSNLIFESLSTGANMKSALNYADELFPEICSSVVAENSPALSKNRVFYGFITTKL